MDRKGRTVWERAVEGGGGKFTDGELEKLPKFVGGSGGEGRGSEGGLGGTFGFGDRGVWRGGPTRLLLNNECCRGNSLLVT